jgi:nicotinamide riboside kinase
LFCDTDLLTTVIWSRELFGGCDGWIEEAARGQRYDLTLLLDVDVPWVGDPVRYRPEDRRSFFERCREALEAAGREYVVLGGGFEERFAEACEQVDALLGRGGPSKREA